MKLVKRPDLSEITRYIPSSDLPQPFSPTTNFAPKKMRKLISSDSIINQQYEGQCAITTTPPIISVTKPNNDLLHFIEKQESYIEQLERESQFYRVNY